MQLNYPKGKKGHAVTAALALIVLLGGFYLVGMFTATPVSGNSICPAGFQAIQTGLAAGDVSCVHLTVQIHHQEQSFVNLGLLAEGYSASCYAFCNGITYTLDPTVLITSIGHAFEQCKVFGTASSDITCTAADSANIIGISSSSSTPLAADTSSSGTCKITSTANEILTGGLVDVAGTITPGALGTTVTTTIAHTFTAMETEPAAYAACLQTELGTATNSIIYAEGTFGPDTLVSANTLAITWSIART